MKITFMGAGSCVFAKNVLGDTMLCPTFYNVEIALYDIDPDRLEEAYVLITRLNENINEGRATVKKYLGVEQRKDALRDANFVINDGGATSKDVKELIKFIKERVQKQHNIRLEEEIAYLE